MSNIKMGLTIEEAAECTGIGRNTMRLPAAGSPGAAPTPQTAAGRRSRSSATWAVATGWPAICAGNGRRIAFSYETPASIVFCRFTRPHRGGIMNPSKGSRPSGQPDRR